jgi:hypothetical protein
VQVLAVAAVVLAVQTAVVSPGDPITVRVAGAAPATPVRVYLSDLVGRLTPVGTIARGRRRLVFRLPGLQVDVYAPAVRVDARVVVGRGRLSVRALPPSGFGALGAPGCAPASPRNVAGTGFSPAEVFGTAAGAQLWALGATMADGTSAVLDGVIGKEKKIIFRLTSGVPTLFYAVAPDGRVVPPVWRQTHAGSSWNRPGWEWGAAFVFDAPGCWGIHAGSPPAQGDVWLVVRS